MWQLQAVECKGAGGVLKGMVCPCAIWASGNPLLRLTIAPFT